MRQYYQLVRDYGKYDLEYTVYEARKAPDGGIQIAALPVNLVGNHPDEILDTLRHIMKDIKSNPPVDKADVDIFHENILHVEDDMYLLDPEHDDIDEETLTKEVLTYGG